MPFRSFVFQFRAGVHRSVVDNAYDCVKLSYGSAYRSFLRAKFGCVYSNYYGYACVATVFHGDGNMYASESWLTNTPSMVDGKLPGHNHLYWPDDPTMACDVTDPSEPIDLGKFLTFCNLVKASDENMGGLTQVDKELRMIRTNDIIRRLSEDFHVDIPMKPFKRISNLSSPIFSVPSPLP